MPNYYDLIKDKIIKYEVHKVARNYYENKYDLSTYYEIGRLLVEAQGGEERAKYGNKLIKEYSEKLTKELGKGYSERNLEYMRRFYLFQKGQQSAALSGKTPPAAANLTWSHYREILSIKNMDEMNYYINECAKHKLSTKKLREKIKSKEYQKLSDSTKEKLKKGENLELPDLVKNPIVININQKLPKNVKENFIKESILYDIDYFLSQIAEGTTYVGNEVKIEYDNNLYFIDILLFNVIYNCYIVVELKANKLKREDIIQTEMYVDLVDKTIKRLGHNKTIGLIVSKKSNQYIIKFSTDKIISTTYELIEN